MKEIKVKPQVRVYDEKHSLMSHITETEMIGKPSLDLRTSVGTIPEVHLNTDLGIQTRSSFHAKTWESPKLFLLCTGMI